LICTGTPGKTSEIKPGDVVEVELERVAMLRKPLVAEKRFLGGSRHDPAVIGFAAALEGGLGHEGVGRPSGELAQSSEPLASANAAAHVPILTVIRFMVFHFNC